MSELPSLAVPLEAAWVQVGQAISAPCGAAGPQDMHSTAQGQVTHNSTRVFQRARAIGGAAVTPTRSAEQHATVPVRSPAERTRASSAAAASPSRSREAHYNLADTPGSSSGGKVGL
jgi:hypothetical protein